MPSTFSNTVKDFFGILRAVSYRVFIAHKWKTPQPMFNILQVKDGTEAIFEEFLERSLTMSLRYNTPISFGPFKTAESMTYIYITHYASTKAFMQVDFGLVFKKISKLRAQATLDTSWTYCKPDTIDKIENCSEILLVGVEGDSEAFSNYLTTHQLLPVATIGAIKDVRGKSLNFYWVFDNNPENFQKIEAFNKSANGLKLYQAKKLPNKNKT